ncbi:hypothetical protein CR513_39789, partial [Mucuna pruriens]
MHPHDEEKIAFIIDADALCYKPQYQRLMDKIFKEVMGVDVEVYVDDMVVKSKEAFERCKALERALIYMRSPQSVREVQQLMGKVTALSRFISRAAKIAMPIFGTLKKGGNFI